MERGDGDRVVEFIETFCRSTKDTLAAPVGEHLRLRPWQSQLLGELFARRADGRRKHRVGLVGLPRKNGKSALGSGIGLFGLFMGPDGGEVYSCAADREQARIVFGVARRMVELDEELSGLAKLYRDAIEIPSTGSVYRVLSSEAFTKEGLSPTLVVYDELHAAPNPELWNVMNLGSGARVDPLVLAITTAGVRSDQTGKDSVCYQLFQHGVRVVAGEVEDPSFYFCWYGSPDESDHKDVKAWRLANPGFGDLLDPEDFESSVIRTPEPEFRTKRMNQWVASAQAWLPHGAWENLDRCGAIADGAQVVLGFDGSYRNDSTALIAISMAGHVNTVGVWERPDDADDSWTIPRGEVHKALEGCFSRWDVLRMYCDPAWWSEEFQRWVDRYGEPPVMEYPNTPQRMVPAAGQFYAAVMDGKLAHDGDPVLARHLRNAVTKESGAGAYIAKGKTAQKVDAAVAAVMAYAAFVDESRVEEVDVQVMFV